MKINVEYNDKPYNVGVTFYGDYGFTTYGGGQQLADRIRKNMTPEQLARHNFMSKRFGVQA